MKIIGLVEGNDKKDGARDQNNANKMSANTTENESTTLGKFNLDLIATATAYSNKSKQNAPDMVVSVEY